MSINEVRLMGNLGRDPEIRSTNSGAKVATLNLATNKKLKDRNTGEMRDVTEWHRVTVWGDGLVEKVIEPYARKGSKVFVGGELRTRDWEDNNGQKRYTTEVVVQGPCSLFELCSGDNRNGPPPPDSPDDYGRQSEGASQSSSNPPPSGDDLDDDIPF